jgi:molybdopterin-guanine dinucleotide biosynthesis protein A
MIPLVQLTGAVLAGGESRRMGRDKALVEFAGRPLWLHQVTTLQAAGASPVGIVRRATQPALPLPADVPLWLDTLSGVGPIAGLHAALEETGTEWLVVAAIDLPRLDVAWFTRLAGQCSLGRGAMVRHDDGAFEPLAAIYPRGARETLRRQLGRGDYSLQSLAQTLVAEGRLTALPLLAEAVGQIENWNTPENCA